MIALLGSVLTLLAAAFIFGAAQGVEDTLIGGATIARVLAAAVGLCAAAGLATARGLLGLRAWARVAILVFGGVLVAFGVLSEVLVLALPLPGMAMPDPAGFAAVRPMLLALYALPCAIGVWWLVLFTRPAVRGAFTADDPLTPPDVPLDIALIAWGCVLGGLVCAVLPLSGTPAFLAGVVLTGWSAGLLYATLAGVQLYAGWGLLRRDARARAVAIWFFTLAVMHGVLGLVIPGIGDESRAYARHLIGLVDPALGAQLDALWWWTSVLLIVGLAVPVWLLWQWRGASASRHPPEP